MRRGRKRREGGRKKMLKEMEEEEERGRKGWGRWGRNWIKNVLWRREEVEEGKYFKKNVW